MKPLSRDEFRYEAGGGNTPEGEDPARFPRLQNCRRCHGGATTLGLRTAIPERLKASTPAATIEAILKQKRNHQTWQALHKQWETDFVVEDTQASTRSNQSKPLPANGRNK